MAVVGLSGVVAISGGYWHSVALKSDGTSVAWGNNSTGQLGDGTSTSHSSPGAISPPWRYDCHDLHQPLEA
ncbi:MAG: hypothetical protein IPI09_20585 [Burkholderiales bacterium]|nr:hypothetical protein [Burkholderiales bacterium]